MEPQVTEGQRKTGPYPESETHVTEHEIASESKACTIGWGLGKTFALFLAGMTIEQPCN